MWSETVFGSLREADIWSDSMASWINHELATRPLHVVQPPPSTSVLILRSKMSPIRMELSQRELILYHQPLHHFTSHLHLSHLFFISVMELAMLVGGVSAVSLSGSSGEGLGSPLFGSFGSSSSCTSRWLRRRGNNGLVVRGSGERSNELSTSRVVFQPFEELKKEDFLVPISPQHSLARQGYSEECEAAINEQINVEYNVSYVYHSMFAYFDRDNIALRGLAKFFKESSEEERQHAEKLMEYQNKRGGKVKLHPILMTPSEFDHAEKGDALYSMELALSMEKLTNEKLLLLHSVADRNNDPQLTDFIESGFLTEQVEAIKKISEYVAQLRRVGKGHGTNQILNSLFVISLFFEQVPLSSFHISL
ncbi:ferritin-4, chloroplastic isoform X1 [Vitis vinifera]|uniref:ferritin-4, chloroplastic isoform X1 n=1 Tax=Vitis vinifera TaxID=29760 RepID=UPI002882E89F|nr:ferritin-4, chloroplastic isoform X1 [Vitis vinifera]